MVGRLGRRRGSWRGGSGGGRGGAGFEMFWGGFVRGRQVVGGLLGGGRWWSGGVRCSFFFLVIGFVYGSCEEFILGI